MRLRYAIELSPRVKARHLSGDDQVTFAPMEAISDGLGGIDISRSGSLGELAAGSYNPFQCGDVLLAKVTPCFENGKKAIVPKLPSKIGYATSEVHVIRPDPAKIDRNFLMYVMGTSTFIFEGVQSMTGAGGLKRISPAAILDHSIMITDIRQQRQIVTYLDRETRRIDDLIAEKDSFITLLREKRVAEISRAVTQGIDPDAPTKPSGADWLGDVPAHWETVRLGVLFKEADRKGDPNLPVLSVSIHSGVSDDEVADEDRIRKVALSEDRSVYQGVLPGDLVYNMMRAWQGGFGAVAAEGLVSPAYVVARPLSDARTKFIELQLRTPQAVEEMRRYSKGIADFRMRLYWEHFRNVRVAIPSPEEQDRILAAIDRETNRIDGLITETVPGHGNETARCAGHAAILVPVAASVSRAFCSALI